MPQRTFWAAQHAVGFDVIYRTDPTRPTDSPSVSLAIRDQAGRPMAIGGVLLPADTISDSMVDVMAAGWLSYLYGEPQDLQSVISGVAAQWRTTKRS